MHASCTDHPRRQLCAHKARSQLRAASACGPPAACRQLFVARHRRSMFGRRVFCVQAVCNALPDYLRDPHVPLAVFAGTWKLFCCRFTIAYTAHYRLCDSALHKSMLLTLTLTLTRSQVGIPTVGLLTARVHRPYSDTMLIK